MKFVKTTTLLLTVAALSAFTYANVRRVSPSAKLERIEIVSFALTGSLSEDEKVLLKTKIESQKGVSACAINSQSNIAAVIFFPVATNESILRAELEKSYLSAEKIVYQPKAGCPVHAVGGSLNSFISLLDLRN